MRIFSVILWIFLNWILGCLSMCSSQYGSTPCQYVPAPPGKTPPCARPGLTYCEHLDQYPSELIHYLVQKWKFNHQSLIINEAKDEFASYFFPPPNTIYGPPAYIPNYVQNNVGQGDGYHYPEPIYIPKPATTFPEQGGLYIPPKTYPEQNYSLGFNGYPEPQYNKDGTFLTYKYTSNFPQGTKTQYNTSPYQPPAIFAPPSYSHINDIWKRSQRLKRSLRRKISQQIGVLSSDTPNSLNTTSVSDSHARRKRQTITGQPLCRSRSNFIMPRAALNSKGNWMYVVNMPEVNSQYTQLVKSETCADQNCNGICGLPQGYSSRCEQKYVQKRLIALEGSGNDLYSDTFWFPSCCVCTISNS